MTQEKIPGRRVILWNARRINNADAIGRQVLRPAKAG